ncbi:EAL domain-containing protein [Gracilibacillus sp. YIM 98692]|uniref:EAL domain-containing protein n=1 Tax=Gracilibacillus sp. YIM 98692 TaxID=2663532 RepID=UPI0013D27FB3|nr:EAL domain-containing protein [Gracilibacillus sp. YIM 98692]
MSTFQTPRYILESKRQCEVSGMDPDEILRPAVNMTDSQLEEKRESYSEILEVVSFFSNKLLNSLKGTPILLVVSDENGFVLDLAGDKTIKATVNQLGIKPGAQFTQEDMGTNVISLALQQRHPIQLIGTDHYHKYLQHIACYGVSFHYTDVDNLLGSISIMTTIELQNPLYLNMLSNVVDSIERELLLRKQNRKLNIMNQVMLTRTRNAIIITDANGIVTEFNEFAEKLSGFTREEIIGRDIYKSPITGKYFHEVINKQKKFTDVEMKFENNNGDMRICLFDAQPIYDNKNSKIIGAFAQLRDITERYLIEEKYNYLAFHDELTGLPNRRYFHNELNKLLNDYNNNKNIALLLIDLDRFKLINDTLGHSNGDRLLKLVSERVKNCIQPGDLLARISGDEFIILLKNINEVNEATKVADKVVEQFKSPFTINHNQFHTTASLGIALYQSDGTDIENFMVQVDAAMYKAKAQGRNGYTVYNPDMYKDSSKELFLETHLRKAVEQNEFILHYQPIFDIKAGKVISFEALIRWDHPELGIIQPNDFISIAEKTGLIIPIGEWVLEEACRKNKEWQDKGLPPFKVNVNLSTQQFLKQNLVEVIKEILEKTKLDPQYLELEITESMAMDCKYAEKVLRELRNIGVQISMDDFGTGYSSLSYLKRFAINCLKIDKAFVRDIINDRNDAQIVRTIIAMAQGLGLKVVAEGVEDSHQFQYLKNQQCDYAQGYYFSKPIPAKELEDHFYTIQKGFKLLN